MKKLFLLMFFLLATQAQATTWYASTSGNNSNNCTQAQSTSTPKLTINAAIACVTATGSGVGHRVEIRGGTYNETIANPTGINGSSWANAFVIASYAGETATIRPVGGNITVELVGDQVHQYIIFDRLVLDTSLLNGGGTGGTYTDNGLVLIGAHHIRFQNGEIKGGGAGATQGEGPLVTMFSYTGAQEDGFNEVINSSIHGAGQSYGFYISTKNNLFQGNQIYNNGGYGIQFYSGVGGGNHTDGNIVTRNDFSDNGHIRGGGFGGITVNTGDNILIYNNKFWANQNGIQVSAGADGTIIQSNSVHGNTSEGIVLYSGAGVNNTVVKNNAISTNGQNFVDDGTGTVTANNFCTTSGGTTNCSASGASAGFVNAGAGDLNIITGSALKDAGETLGAPYDKDFFNVTRPQGASYDIGCCEFTVVPVPSRRRLVVYY